VFDSDGRRIAEYNETTGALIREYVWMGWNPVAVIEGGTVYYIRADHIGRPVFATNGNGAKVWTATYLPFGGVHTSTGIPIDARFPGQWFQSESGLHQNWMRDYDPTTGRYLQADPLGLIAGMNVYGYANQSPMMYIDPRGENPVIVAGIVAGALIGGGAGYLETGCWEGALAGAIVGGLIGGGAGLLPHGMLTTFGAGSGEGFAGLAIAHLLASENFCGCTSRPWSWKRAFGISAMSGGGAVFGWAAAGAGTGYYPFIGAVMEGLGGEMAAEMADGLGTSTGTFE
jgi:RHS repeat-associated protein